MAAAEPEWKSSPVVGEEKTPGETGETGAAAAASASVVIRRNSSLRDADVDADARPSPQKSLRLPAIVVRPRRRRVFVGQLLTERTLPPGRPLIWGASSSPSMTRRRIKTGNASSSRRSWREFDVEAFPSRCHPLVVK